MYCLRTINIGVWPEALVEVRLLRKTVVVSFSVALVLLSSCSTVTVAMSSPATVRL